MKVLQIIDSLNIGGAERMSVSIANVLSENGIESYLVASRKGGALLQFLIPPVIFCSIEKKNGLDIAGFRRLLKIIKKAKPDIIHAHSTSIYWAIGVKLFLKNIKVIWHDHYGLSDNLKDNERSLLRYVSRWIDGVIVVNSVLEGWCRRNLNIDANNIVYLRNFPYLTLPKPAIESKKMILLHLANFRPQKDQLTLLEAVKIVKQAGTNFELWLAGTYVDSDWVNLVQKRIETLDLGKEVKILGPVENSGEILAKASIGILSSISEGLPVALLEYGLAGLPVICTDTGQCKSVLGNGALGIVVPPSNPVILAQAIIELTGNPAKREQLATAFNEHVREEYGAEKFLSGYLKLLKRII
ncbi:MAG: glycosyltransferase family 4 protein [Ferruginibacter sp.]